MSAQILRAQLFIITTLLSGLFISIPSAYAETKIEINNQMGETDTSVDVKQNSSVRINSNNSSTVRNYVEVNGKVYVDETKENTGNTGTDIDVHVKNGQGTVKYNMNGEDKIIEITPDENKKSVKEQEKKSDNKSDPSADKSQTIIEEMHEELKKFLSKLSSLFSS